MIETALVPLEIVSESVAKTSSFGYGTHKMPCMFAVLFVLTNGNNMTVEIACYGREQGTLKQIVVLPEDIKYEKRSIDIRISVPMDVCSCFLVNFLSSNPY